MLDFIVDLFDPTGFTPLRDSPGWSTGLTWLHMGSDLALWLALLSIGLVVFYFSRQRRLSLSGSLSLFAALLLACGLTHFVEAVAYRYPVYRLSGLCKLVSA